MNSLVTIEELRKALPTKSNIVTPEAVDIINTCRNDPEFQGESLIKTASIYQGILKNNRNSISEYLNAIRFCAYLGTHNSSTTEAYKRVFCDRDFVKERVDLPTTSSKYKELPSAASRYRKTKLVTDILTVSQVPLDLIFCGERYKALGVLANIMEDEGIHARDRVNAAKELLAATKGADNVKIELDVGVKESSAVEQLNKQLTEMADKTSLYLREGVMTLDEVGSLKPKEENIIEGDFKSA